jgi:colicin import membrane protein
VRYVPRHEGPRYFAAALAGSVHLLFFALLVFGLSWQIRSPSPVSVELWSAPPVPQQPPPPPQRVQPRPEPPQPAPPPPKVAPKVEEPSVQRPDIALEKVRQQKAAQEQVERERKVREDQARVEREKKQREELQREDRERMDREARRELQEADTRRLQEQLNRESEHVQSELSKNPPASPIDSAASDAWKSRIAARIRANIVVPDGLIGNPEAVFDVVQLPTGEVISLKLSKSSGFQAYDEAVERAIRKSSPLPKADRSDLFQRQLKLTFRPQDR